MSDESLGVEIPDAAPAATPRPPRPRLRLGAIVWGLIVTATAAVALSLASARESRAGVAEWLGGLTVGAIGLILLLAAGSVVLLISLVTVTRRALRGEEHPPVA
jgi:hypothetical protein